MTPKWRTKGVATTTLMILASAIFCLFLFLFLSHSCLAGVPAASSEIYPNVGMTFPGYYIRPTRRRVLAVGSTPLSRLDQVRKQLDSVRTLLDSHAASNRKILLERSKFVRIFTQHGHDFERIMSDPSYQPLFDPNAASINASTLLRFEKDVNHQVRVTWKTLREANESFDSDKNKIEKLNAKHDKMNVNLTKANQDADYKGLIAARSIPRSLHCLTMRLMQERLENPDRYKFICGGQKSMLEDPKLYHYAIFSDNVLAASVVVNSLVKNAKEPWKHVLHIVTDKINLEAMQVMFQCMDHRGAHFEVKAVEDYSFLNSSYVPVLKQLESARTQSFYFGSMPDNPTKQSDSSKIKFRNPKYLSILNHLRFYLPEMYPKLHRILFLDDDIVVQKDLTGLWDVSMDGKVNGAVETCFGSFHRYAQYMNFSHPLIKEKFDPKACAWAYGMNMFDLDAWRRENSTQQYHYWQNMNENRTLWKLGTLPPGLITFYSTTKPLNKSWHVLGLGYNPNVRMDDIEKAAVVHYNGNRKPWLAIAIDKFRPIWAKYVDYDSEFVRACDSDFED